MKTLSVIALGLALLASAAPGFAQSSIDCFLKIEGIKGEATQSPHAEWIEILSFQHSITNPPPSGSMAGGGKVQFGDLAVSKHVDLATSKLMEKCAKGDVLRDVTLVCSREGQDFYTIKLKDVYVVAIQSSWEDGGKSPLPVEEVTFHYGEIRWEYFPQKPDGKLGSPEKGGWDVKANKFAP